MREIESKSILGPRDIRDMIISGEISPDEGITRWRETERVKVLSGFLVEQDRVHYLQRADLEERVRHSVALPIIAVVGAVDGTLEALAYGVAEITETGTFLISRTTKRAKDGWRRGQQK